MYTILPYRFNAASLWPIADRQSRHESPGLDLGVLVSTLYSRRSNMEVRGTYSCSRYFRISMTHTCGTIFQARTTLPITPLSHESRKSEMREHSTRSVDPDPENSLAPASLFHRDTATERSIVECNIMLRMYGISYRRTPAIGRWP
jgi:hypothetical protein